MPIDIHGGGNDLIFPHHENEIAQGVCANHVGYANYWMHNGFLNMGDRKMSKSLGNVALVHDLIQRWPPEALRWASARLPLPSAAELDRRGDRAGEERARYALRRVCGARRMWLRQGINHHLLSLKPCATTSTPHGPTPSCSLWQVG